MHRLPRTPLVVLFVSAPVLLRAQARASASDYAYTAPPGWAVNQYPDGITLTSPTAVTGERCLLTMWPLRPAGPSLMSDAEAAFREVFKTYEPRMQTSRGSSMPPVVVRGTSGQGWDYIMLKRGIGKAPAGGMTFQTLLGFVLVAKLDQRVAVVSGLSKDPLVSTCFGELAGNVWPRFFYSLRFNGWTTPTQSSTPPKKLVGVWTTASATVADQFTFAANGRYGGASAVQHYNAVSSTEVVATTQAFFGDGAFSVHEDTIAMTPDNHSRPAENGLFRVEEESQDNGATWSPVLYLLRVSRVDGADYEVRYKRERRE